MPETTDRPISYSERKKGRKSRSLITKHHWTQPIKKAYDAFEYVHNTGREYKGSDPITKRIDSQTFANRNEQYYTHHTIDSTYIYIISKYIGTYLFFKIGSGGSGENNFGSGRLANAQTFLIPGLRESVGFQVHFLFFYDRLLNHDYTNIPVNKYIEQQVHKNLRHEFQTANIKFHTERSSEWYVVNLNEMRFFLGFVIDIIASYQINPLECWKLTPQGKTVFPLPEDWKSRMKHNPDYIHYAKQIEGVREKVVPVGAQIAKIEFETLDGKGNVELFESVFLDPNPYILSIGEYTFQCKAFKKNMMAFGENQPLQMNEIYAELQWLGNTMDDSSMRKTMKEQYKIQLHPIKLRDQTTHYYMYIGDLLNLVKRKMNNAEYDEWELKSNYLYYKERIKDVIEIEVDDRTVLPAYCFQKEFQHYWAEKMYNDPQYQFIEDYELNKTDTKHMWKIIKYFPDSQTGNFNVERVKVLGDDHYEVEGSNEVVPIIRMMKIMDVSEGEQLELKKQKQKKEKEIRIKDGIQVFGKTIKQGTVVKIQQNYFTYYDQFGVPVDISSYTGWDTFIVKKTYKKEHHSDNLNPWFDVQPYPPTSKRIYEILSTDDVLKEKLKIIAPDVSSATRKTRKSLSEKSQKSPSPKSPSPKNQTRSQMDSRLSPSLPLIIESPRFKTYNILRMIPLKDPKRKFRENYTSLTKYHYFQIMAVDKKNQLYEIKYMEPWDKRKLWGLDPIGSKRANRVYLETHPFQLFHAFAELVKEKKTGTAVNPKMQTDLDAYKKTLKPERQSKRIRLQSPSTSTRRTKKRKNDV